MTLRNLIVLACCSTGIACAAANLAVNPTIVTNDYSGWLTFTATGLPSAGQSVRVEIFCDLRTNGVVDAIDPLMQSFVVTDGVIPMIAGVTNLNVPGDNDALANGQIVAQVSFPGLDKTFSLIAGPYLCRLSSPSNTFTPVTGSFQIRQKPYAQSVSGIVYSGNLANGLSNALVVVFDADFNAVGGALANSRGAYSLYVQPGTYTVWPFVPGYFAGQEGWTGTIGPGGSVSTAHIPMVAGPFSVAGRLKDRVTGAGLPGAPIVGYQSSNLYAATFTDAAGNYSLRVSPALWEVGYDQNRMPLLGYVAAATMPKTNVTSDIANFDLSVTKANALIHGTLRDNHVPANPLASVVISAEDARRSYRMAGLTSSGDGRYSLGVVAGNWWIEPDSDSLATLGCLGTGTNWIALPGAAARMDLVARNVTARLAGRMVDEYGYPISSATVRATDTNGTWVASAVTDYLTGGFDLGVFGGTWKVGLDPQTAAGWYLANYELTRTVADGQTITLLNFRVRYATGAGSGLVTNQLGVALEGLGVRGSSVIAGTNYAVYAVTDATGTYWGPMLPGQWTFVPDCFGYGGLSFQGCECVPGASRIVVAGDSNILPTFAATPLSRPTLESPAFSSGTGFSFNVSGPTNRTFQVLDSSNLSDWNSLFATNPGGGSFRFTTSNSPATPARAFRVLVQ